MILIIRFERILLSTLRIWFSLIRSFFKHEKSNFIWEFSIFCCVFTIWWAYLLSIIRVSYWFFSTSIWRYSCKRILMRNLWYQWLSFSWNLSKVFLRWQSCTWLWAVFNSILLNFSSSLQLSFFLSLSLFFSLSLFSFSQNKIMQNDWFSLNSADSEAATCSLFQRLSTTCLSSSVLMSFSLSYCFMSMCLRPQIWYWWNNFKNSSLRMISKRCYYHWNKKWMIITSSVRQRWWMKRFESCKIHSWTLSLLTHR